MVHRAPDTRLLTSLLSSEKDVQKALHSIPSSSAAFAAYAAASPPHVAQTILGVGGAIAGADEALRTYAASVERWRDTLERVRKMEDEVANMIRDRDILVGRLLKLSSSKKNRDSIVIPPTCASPPPSSLSHSTLSLPSVASSPNVSSKLTTAQAELQACESQLAAKEKELDQLRFTAIRDGLTDRCRAMVECGWVWGEMGREGLRVLHEGPTDCEAMPNGHSGAKPLPTFPSGASSDLSSLGPEQSASQVGVPTANGINGYNMNGDANPAFVRSMSPTGRPNAAPIQRPAETDGDYTPRLSIPPAHAISDNSPFPISHSQTHINGGARMERRITEVSEPASGSEDAESSDEEGAALQVIENPRFTQPTSSPLTENLPPTPDAPSSAGHARGLFARRHHKQQDSTSSIGTQPSTSGSRWLHRSKPRAATVSDTHVPVATYGVPPPDAGRGRERERKTSVWGGFVGLFKPKPKDRESIDEEVPRSRRWRRGSVSSDSSEEGGRPAWREEPGQGALSFDLGRQKAQSPSPPGGRLKKRRAVSQAPPPSASVSGTGSGWASDSGRKSALKKTAMKSASDVDVTPRARSPATPTPMAPPPRPPAPAPVQARPPQPTPVQARPQRTPSAPMKPAIRPTSALQLTGDLSRSSSLSKQSVRSAPAHPTTPSRRGAVSPGPTTLVPAGRATLGRSASTGKAVQPTPRGGPKRASLPVSASESAVATAGPAFPSAKTSVPGVTVAQPARAATWSRAHAGAPPVGEDQPSLMTIVEGVTKTNRAGWSAVESSKAGRALVRPPPAMAIADGGARRSHSHRSAEKRLEPVLGLQGVRAPPPLSAVDVETGKARERTRLEREMEGLRAPPPVSDPMAAAYVAYKLETPRPSPLPAKSPLRSALRAPSPPMPPPVLEVPSAPPRVRAPSPAPPPAPPPPTPATTAKTADDAASTVSSYESAHEEFYFSPDLPADAPAVPAKDAMQSSPGGGSDVSNSTVAAGEAPVRRKSVRMSLQPTFSPTPPALDDEGEEEPWLGEHHGRRGAETRRGRREPEPEEKKEKEKERDLWEDSDSEDEEYRRAKDSLRRAGRKKKW